MRHITRQRLGTADSVIGNQPFYAGPGESRLSIDDSRASLEITESKLDAGVVRPARVAPGIGEALRRLPKRDAPDDQFATIGEGFIIAAAQLRLEADVLWTSRLGREAVGKDALPGPPGVDLLGEDGEGAL